MAVVHSSAPTSIDAWESNLLGQVVAYLTSQDVIQLLHTGNSLLTHKLATCTKRFCICIKLKQCEEPILLDSMLALITKRFPNLTHLAVYGLNPDRPQYCAIHSRFALPNSLTTLNLSTNPKGYKYVTDGFYRWPFN
jgi:hypothetical protein